MSQFLNVVKALSAKSDNSKVAYAFGSYLSNPQLPRFIVPSGSSVHSVKLLLYDFLSYCSLSFNIPCDLSLLRMEIFGSSNPSVLVQ